MNRRDFLKKSISGIGTAATSFSVLDLYLSLITSGMMNRAYAIESEGETSFLEKKFVNLSLAGAPASWFWNSPLRPNGTSDPFKYNGEDNPNTSMLWTKFSSNSSMPSGLTGVYQTTQIGSHHLPYLWSADVPTPNGGKESMTALAQNAFMARGIRGIDNHEVSRFLQVHPTSGPSIGGLLAEQSSNPLPAIGFAAEPAYFKSSKGLIQHQVPYVFNGQPFDLTFSSFNLSSPIQISDPVIGAKIDQVLEKMKSHSGLKHGLLPSSYKDRLNAKKLMLNQFNLMRGSYLSLVTKYKNLIERAIRDSTLGLTGVHDQVIGSSVTLPDERMNFSTNILYAGQNMQSIFNNASLLFLAEQMALTEFLLLGGGGTSCFGSSINLRVYEMLSNVVADKVLINGALVNNHTFDMQVDSHYLGVYAHVLFFTRYFHAIAAVLNELIKALKLKSVGSGNLFDQTVIAVTSEFGRIPEVGTQRGSHHGTTAGNYTLFSGMIPTLTVVGDINANPSFGSNQPGTFGDGASMAFTDGAQPLLGNAVSSVAALLEIESPTPNNKSFLVKNSETQKFSLAAPSAKNKI